ESDRELARVDGDVLLPVVGERVESALDEPHRSLRRIRVDHLVVLAVRLGSEGGRPLAVDALTAIPPQDLVGPISGLVDGERDSVAGHSEVSLENTYEARPASGYDDRAYSASLRRRSTASTASGMTSTSVISLRLSLRPSRRSAIARAAHRAAARS